MPFGVDDAIMMAPAAISMIQQLIGGDRQGKAQQDALQVQMENLAFQREQAKKQYELATAGRTNARGDQTRYIPGQGWITINSPDTASRISVDNALNTKEAQRQFSQGEPTRTRNLTRQVQESSAAEPLLMQEAQGFGLPTKAGVKGKNAIAAATAASEANDLNQNAAAGAALRTGERMPVMSGTGATGLRTALARSDVEGDSMFEAALKAAQGNKLDPYNMLATRASGAVPNLPESLSGDLNAGLGQAATVGAMRGVGTGAGVNDASKAYGSQAMLGGQMQQPSYDAFAGALAKMLKGKWGSSSGSDGPVFNDTTFSGRTSTGDTYG